VVQLFGGDDAKCGVGGTPSGIVGKARTNEASLGFFGWLPRIDDLQGSISRPSRHQWVKFGAGAGAGVRNMCNVIWEILRRGGIQRVGGFTIAIIRAAMGKLLFGG